MFGSNADGSEDPGIKSWEILALVGLIGFATLGRLSTTVIDIAVDRDWSVLARSYTSRSTKLTTRSSLPRSSCSHNGQLNPAHYRSNPRVLVISSSTPNPTTNLTLFNASLRRAFLLCKLLSPLFVSLLTSLTSYPRAAAILLGMSMMSLGVESWWIGVVWREWGCLEEAEEERRRKREEVGSGRGGEAGEVGDSGRWYEVSGETVEDVLEFARMPIFLSESGWWGRGKVAEC